VTDFPPPNRLCRVANLTRPAISGGGCFARRQRKTTYAYSSAFRMRRTGSTPRRASFESLLVRHLREVRASSWLHFSFGGGGRRIRMSMDGRARWLDNAFVERLWRTVKYEEVYLKDYGSVPEALAGLSN
jgi:hypothetical protein